MTIDIEKLKAQVIRADNGDEIAHDGLADEMIPNFNRLFEELESDRAQLAGRAGVVPEAWMHILCSRDDELPGNKPWVMLSETGEHPFGIQGRDYGGDFWVVSKPLYAAPAAPIPPQAPQPVQPPVSVEDDLPPLPEPQVASVLIHLDNGEDVHEDCYTADQMREYAAQARAQLDRTQVMSEDEFDAAMSRIDSGLSVAEYNKAIAALKQKLRITKEKP